MEVGGGGWRWVEVGARFSNTQNVKVFVINLVVSFPHKKRFSQQCF